MKLLELALVLAAALTPMFALAGDLSDGDELLKGGAGVAAASAVVACYRTWKGHHKEDA